MSAGPRCVAELSADRVCRRRSNYEKASTRRYATGSHALASSRHIRAPRSSAAAGPGAAAPQARGVLLHKVSAPFRRLADFRTLGAPIRVGPVVKGLVNPWSLTFLPDGNMLVTERPGRLRLVRNGILSPQPIAGVPAVFARGQGGLMEVALHPRFADNKYIYLTYSKPANVARLRRSRAAARHRTADVRDISSPTPGHGRRALDRRFAVGRTECFMTVGERNDRRRPG